MTFPQFIADKRIITTESYMRFFFENTLGIEFLFDVTPLALHIYGEQYYIEQLANGRFQVGAGDEDAIQGTLAEMEAVLYQYIQDCLASEL